MTRWEYSPTPSRGEVARGVAAAVALLSLVAGTPTLLLLLGANPLHLLPTQWPSLAQIRTWPADAWPVLRIAFADGTLITTLVTVLAWGAWLVLDVMIAAETVLQLRHGVASARHRLSKTNPRTWIAALVSAVLIALGTGTGWALPSGTPVAVAAAGTPPPPSNTTAGAGNAAWVEFLATHTHQQPDQPVAATRTSVPDTVRPDCPRYTVVHGDSYWALAEAHLGDGARWREIEALNADRIGANPDYLQPGWILLLPPDATRLPAPATSAQGREIVVARGETLSEIAERELGRPDAWRVIFDANYRRTQPDGRALVDPGRLLPGWTLIIPTTTPTTTSTPPPAPGTAPIAPAAPPPATERPHPAPERSELATPPPSTPSPRSPAPSAPPPQVSTPPGPQAATRNSPAAAVSLPSDALVSVSLAAAVTVLAALVRRQRRRRRRITGTLTPPGPPPPPLTPAVAAMDHATRTASPNEDAHTAAPEGEPGVPVGEQFPRTRAWPPPAPTLTGHSDDGEHRLDLTTVAGVGLTGPGAHGAARALAATVVSADTLHPGHLCVAGPDALTALATDTEGRDGAGEVLSATPGITVVDEEREALALLEAELARRTRAVEDHQLHTELHHQDASTGDHHDVEVDVDGQAGGDVAAVQSATFNACRAADPAEALSNLLVLSRPSAAMRQRWAAVLELGRGLGIHGVLLDDWPTHVDVAADGTIATTTAEALVDDARLDTLTPTDATEVWRLVHAARTATQPPDESAADPHRLSATGPNDGGHAPEVEVAADDVPIEPSSQAVVRVRLLGGVLVEVAGREVTGMRSLSREVLAYLTARPDGASAARLEEDLLPEAASANRRDHVHAAISHTRGALRKATGLADARFITSHDGRYRLDAELVTTDWWEITAARRRGRTTRDPAQRQTALETIAELARAGTPLDGAGYSWAVPIAEAWTSEVLDALVALASTIEDTDPDSAVDVLQLATRWDPYNEQLYQHIIRLQLGSDRADAAHSTYRALRARLADIDCEPDPTTEALLHPLPATRR